VKIFLAGDWVDKPKKIEVRNRADNLIYTAEKTLKDMGDKVKEEDKKAVEEKSKALKDILETGSREDIEAKTNELSEAVQKVGAAAYAQQPADSSQQSAGQTDDSGNGKKKDEKKDEKKACVKVYPKAHSWFLKNLRPLKPFPVKGSLGIYNLKLKTIPISSKD